MHSNGRIYIDPNSTGVEIADVQQVLGRGTGDLGLLCSDMEWYDTETTDQQGNPVYALRRVGKTNPWAKCKPERIHKLGLLTLAERQENYFGLDVPIRQTGGSIADFLAAYPSGWSYLPPRGNSPTPHEDYRLRDFEEYYHTANMFVDIANCILPTRYLAAAGNVGATFAIGIREGNNLPAGSIGIGSRNGSTLTADGWMLGNTAFCDLYFGLIFVDGNDSSKKIVTSQSQLYVTAQNAGREISIAQASSDDTLVGLNKDHTYMVYPVLSVSSHSSLTDWATTDVVVALPIDPFSFEIDSPQSAQNIGFVSGGASFKNAALTVGFRIAMSGTPDTISTVQYVIKAASGSGDTTGSTLFTGTVLNLTTSASQFVSRSARVTNPDWVYVYAYNEASPTVNASAWYIVRTGGFDPDDPFGPTPVD